MARKEVTIHEVFGRGFIPPAEMRDLLNRLETDSRPLTSADLLPVAKLIAAKIAKLKSEKEKLVIAVDAIRDMYSMARDQRERVYYKNELTSDDYLAVLRKVGDALLNLVYKEYIKTADPASPLPEFLNMRRLLPGRADDKYELNHERIYRIGSFTRDYGDKNDKAQLIKGLQKAARLPPHNNVVTVLAVDEKRLAAIVENIRNLKTLASASQDVNDGKITPLELLQVIYDAIKGAKFYADNGLVLQDLCPRNIGYVTKGGKLDRGILFDLSMLNPSGSRVKRLIPRFYRWQQSNAYFASDQDRLMPAEMTQQIGLCLEEVVEKLPSPYNSDNEITELIAAMVTQNREKVISLEKAEKTLGAILNKYKSKKCK